MITIIPSSRLVYRDSECIGNLSQSEINILCRLKQSEGSTVSRDELLNAGWPDRIVVANSVNMAIKNIRDVFSRVHDAPVIITNPKEGFTLLSGIITIEPSQLAAASEQIRPQKERDIKAPLHEYERRQYIYPVIISFVIFLWGCALTMHYLEREPECLKNQDNRVCYFGDDIHSAPQHDAPKSHGVYLYGKDSVTGQVIYEEIKTN